MQCCLCGAQYVQMGLQDAATTTAAVRAMGSKHLSMHVCTQPDNQPELMLSCNC